MRFLKTKKNCILDAFILFYYYLIYEYIIIPIKDYSNSLIFQVIIKYIKI